MNNTRRAEQILGYGINTTQDEAEEREYTCIDGVIYTDLFEGTPIVGNFGIFKPAFNGRTHNIDYFNEVILPSNYNGRVKITAKWGSDKFMSDIDGLLQWLDKDPTTSLNNAGVSSKKIEDFTVSFRTADETQSGVETILNEGYGFYVRKPLIVTIGSEKPDAGRYF